MKLSETIGDQRKVHLDYVEGRWKQLHESSNDRAEKAWAYLMLTNSGSAIAVVSFMGANKSLTPIPDAPIMLLFFLAGVALVGLGHAIGYYRSNWLFSGWRNDVSGYYADKLTWDELLEQDKQRSRYFVWADVVAWFSFGSFLSGLGIGVFGVFNAIRIVS